MENLTIWLPTYSLHCGGRGIGFHKKTGSQKRTGLV